MSNIRTEMTVLSRHEGEWVGTYTLVDLAGKILDTYQSHLSCLFPESGDYPYYQINRYTWSDSKKEEYHFPCIYQDKKLLFVSDRLEGKAWEVDERTIIFNFNYKHLPETYLYEMLQISPCGNYRSRTWHWFKDHIVYQRTLIQEERFK
jgi:hypothetical protein